nr:hypothetical protein [Tanacetum cinerariifolium]
MKDKFQMSSMEELTFFLGKSASTPIDAEKPLLKDSDGEDIDVHTYSTASVLFQLLVSTASLFYCFQFQLVFNSPMLHVLRVEIVINSPWMLSKNWLVQKQTAFGKDISNPLMADNLPKIVWFSTHHVTFMKSWLVQKQTALGQTATGKEFSNPFMAAQKAAKRRKLSEEAQEAKDLRKRLEVVDDEDDDVFIEATPLARKVLVVDYQIVLVDNKPRFKIIKADETHQLYISFTTLLKNFDREDLENLRGIVKDRFSTSKPTNFSDEYLLLTLKTMFEEPDRQDAIWRNQKSVHVQLFLLVERRYPLSRFTLEQLVNVTRLQVEEDSEMSLELLKFTRQQLQEYQQG